MYSQQVFFHCVFTPQCASHFPIKNNKKQQHACRQKPNYSLQTTNGGGSVFGLFSDKCAPLTFPLSTLPRPTWINTEGSGRAVRWLAELLSEQIEEIMTRGGLTAALSHR